MKFHLDGELMVKCSLEEVFSNLSKPEFIVGCIPDLQSYVIHDSNRFDAKIGIGIALIRGTVEMKFTLEDERPPNHARLLGDGSGAGSKMHIENTFDLIQEADSTRMKWESNADLSGLMAGMGGNMLKQQSEKQVNQIFSNIKSKLER